MEAKYICRGEQEGTCQFLIPPSEIELTLGILKLMLEMHPDNDAVADLFKSVFLFAQKQ